MTEKTAPWWRSFAGKRRKAARESAEVLEQDLRGHESIGSTQHPSTEHDQRRNTPTCTKDGPSLPSDETYDDSAVQPTFSQSSNRRALTVSRSGRFKEKGRRMRVGLPKSGDEGTPAAAKASDNQSKR